MRFRRFIAGISRSLRVSIQRRGDDDTHLHPGAHLPTVPASGAEPRRRARLRCGGLPALSQAHRRVPARRGNARPAPAAPTDAECRARVPARPATTPATGTRLLRPAAATARQRAHADGAGDCPRGLRVVALKRAAYTNRASKVHYLPPSLRFPPLREGNRERRAYSVPPACRGNLKEGVLVYPYFCELWLSDWYKVRQWMAENRTHAYTVSCSKPSVVRSS